MKINKNFFLNKIEKNINKAKKILIGFSGGLDSTVLLHALKKIKKKKKITIRAIHINHNLNKECDNWMKHCQKICLKWKIPLYSKKIKIKNFKEKGIECTARNERYKIFKKNVLPKEIIVTGQHLNDQVETFLLALKRGSGPNGLSSMKKFIPFFNTLLIRPLLNFNKKEILHYAEKNSLHWIEDKSNKNIKYDRNFLRLKIIPKFNQRWPFFLKSVYKSCKLCCNQEQLIEELLKKDLSKIITKNGSLKINFLKTCSTIKRNALIRNWFKLHKVIMPSYTKLKKIWYEIALAKKNANPKINLENYIITRYKKEIWIIPKFQDISKICLKWNISSSIKLPDNLGILTTTKKKGTTLRYPKKNEKITIKFKLKEKIKINKKQKLQKTKNIWKKFNIPPWMRNRIPLIYYNNILMAAVNTFTTEFGKILHKKKIKIQWIKNKNSIYKKIEKY